jgi:hypothetical protein
LIRPLVGAGVVAGLLLVAVTAGGQAGFRIAHQRDRDEPASTVVTGTVFNDDGRDVHDVWVTTEALDAAGKVVATGITFVSSLIPGHGRAAFTAKLPRVEARTFRLAVTSFRYGAGSQSP